MYKKIFLCLLLILFLIIPNSVFAQNNNSMSFNDYYIELTVNENNTVEVYKAMQVNFNTTQQFYFKIPIKNEVIKKDGTITYNQAKVDKISTNIGVTQTEKGNYYILTFKDINNAQTKDKTYAYKYLYNLGIDKNDNYDEFYLNIIDNYWNTEFSNIRFNIIMPKEFDFSKVDLVSSIKGKLDTSNITYYEKDNIIMGNYTEDLSPNEKIGIRIELPEGYFVGAETIDTIKLIDSKYVPYLYIIPAICFVLIFIWSRPKKEEVTVYESIEYYPLKEYDSLEYAAMRYGFVTTFKVISLLYYLAHNGYIKFTIIPGKEDNILITKIKKYNGNKEYLYFLMQELFKNSDEIYIKDLKRKTISKMFHNVTKQFTKINGIGKFVKGKSFVKYLVSFFMIIFCLNITVYTTLSDYIDLFTYFMSGNCLFSITILGCILVTIASFKVDREGVKEKFPLYIFLVILIVLCLSTTSFFEVLKSEKTYLYIFIYHITLIILMLKNIKNVPERTIYGTQMLTKVKGFEKFVLTAEKSRLEMLLEENPMYFYETLAYANAIGRMKIWMNKFKDINMEAPPWFESSNPFTTTEFITSMLKMNTFIILDLEYDRFD